MDRRSADDALIGTITAAGVFTFTLSGSWGSSGDHVWTGLISTWEANVNNFTVWTEGAGASHGKAGLDDVVNNTAITAAGVQKCDVSNTHRVVCVQ